MKKITKFKKFDKHLRIFLLISISLSMLVGIAHAGLLASKEIVIVGHFAIPEIASYCIVFGAAMMTVMGIYYYLALIPEKDK